MPLYAGRTTILLELVRERFNRDLKVAEKDAHAAGSTLGTKLQTGMSSRFRGFGSKLGAIVKRSMLPVGAALAAGAVVGVKSAADLGESINKASEIFGKNKDQILEWSTTTANAFGLSRAQALEAAAGFGTMLDTSGVATKELGPMSSRLVELAADMASFNNEDPSDMLDRLRSGLAGEAEPLRRFGILLSEATITEQAYKDGLAERGEALTDAQKVQARYNVMLAQTTKQQGDFGRTAESMPNQIRRLRAQFSDLSAQIGEKLLPVAVKILTWLNDNLPEAIEWASDAIETFSNAWNAIIPVVGDVIAFILTAWRGFLGVFIGIAGGIVDAAATAFGWVPGIGEKIRRFRRDFHETSQRILGDLDEQIARFHGWGEKSSNSIERVANQWGGLKNAIEKGISPGVIRAEAQTFTGDGPGFGNTPSAMATAVMTAVPGLQRITSGWRPLDAGSYHSVPPPHNAVDIGGQNLMGVARALLARFGISAFKELIFTPLGFSIKDGRRVAPLAAASHYKHVHVADMGKIIKGPAMIAQGNITEAHIPLSGPGARNWPMGNVTVNVDARGSNLTKSQVEQAVYSGIEASRRRDARHDLTRGRR